jgi:PAS domain-containing protein
MGQTCRAAFPDIWEDIYGQFDQAETSGLAVDVHDLPLMTHRNGYLEETYFTGSFNPIRDLDGSVGGVYNSTHEVTRSKILARRTAMMKRLIIPSNLHSGGLASHVMPALEAGAPDITMALLYEVDENGTRVSLQGSLGVPSAHEIRIEHADLDSLPLAGLIPLLRTAKTETITMPIDDRFEGIQWAGFDEPSLNFSVLPLSAAGRLLGFLVVGVNPRRPIDEDHHQFMADLSVKIASIAATLIGADEERRRAARVEKQLMDSERKIRYMAQNAGVGMQNLSFDGTTIWANDRYYELTGHPRPEEAQYKFSFLDVFHDEDRNKASEAWLALSDEKRSVSLELRLKKSFTPPGGSPQPAWILALGALYMENGSATSIMTSTTDISQLKWAETLEARKASDAREAKRQQEEFIDIVSHEMRVRF